MAKLSQEVFYIPYGDCYIVYAPLRGVAILCNAAMVDFLSLLYAGDKSLLDNPAYAEIAASLGSTGLLEEQAEETLLKYESSDSGFCPTRVTFLVTTECNLRCVYCYASAGEQKVTIPFEICKAAIDLIVDNAVSLNTTDCHVAFHGGGEPTTAFPLIRQCVGYAREQAERHGIQSSFSIVTNGILNRSQIEWLAANMNSISVSFDGPRDIQNRQRPLQNGKGSFDRVFRTIKLLEQLGSYPFVRATVTNESAKQMREIARFFAESFESPEFQLEPVAVCGRCGVSGYQEPTVDEFVRGAEEAIEEAEKFGKRVVCSAALETFPNLAEAYCGVAAPNFAITPEGIVTACYEVSAPSDPRGSFFFFGRYCPSEKRFVFDERVIRELRSHVIQNIDRCKDCFCRWQCAGDCPVRSVWRYPRDGEESDFRCQITREFVKRRLARAFNEQDRV